MGCLLLSALISYHCPSSPTIPSHTGLFVKLLIPWGFSTCRHCCLDIPLDILMALTFTTFRSLLPKNHCHTLAHSIYKITPCHSYSPILLHFLSQNLLSSHMGIYYFFSYHWNRIVWPLPLEQKFLRAFIVWFTAILRVSRTDSRT